MAQYVSTAYNLARCGVSMLPFQKFSQETSKLFLALDLIDTCYTAHSVKEELSNNKIPKTRKYQAVEGMTCIAVFSLLFARICSNVPAQIDLGKILQTTPDLTASWKTPRVAACITALFGLRVTLNMGLSILRTSASDTSVAPIINLAAQLFTWRNVLQTKWLEVTRTYPHPFQSMACTVTEGGTLDSFKQTATEMKASFLLKITSCATLEHTIKSIHEYSSNMFNNSSWSRFWVREQQALKIKENYADRLSMEAFTKSLTSKFSFFRRLETLNRLGRPCKVIYNVILGAGCSKPSWISSITTTIFHTDQAVVVPDTTLAAVKWLWKEGRPLRQITEWARVNFLGK